MATRIREAIQHVYAKWTDAYRSGDAAAVASLYTADGQILPPGGGPVRGHEAIRGMLQALFEQGIAGIDLETVEAEQHGEAAFEVGTAALRGRDGTVLDELNYIVVWKHEDGEWKLHRDIFNSSRPAA